MAVWMAGAKVDKTTASWQLVRKSASLISYTNEKKKYAIIYVSF